LGGFSPLKFLLLNQTFHPDVMASAQYLTELACALVERGHEVTVVTSRRAYDHPATRFPGQETWRGIRIHRVASTAFGKGAKWRRAVDFASFMFSCGARLARLPKQDVVVALTSPPLISFLGAWLARLRGSRFAHWVMDFNPDEAIAAGWLRPGSFVARLLERMSRFSLKRAHKIIALDRFMRDRIVAKGIPPEKVAVIPPWSQDDQVRYDAAGRERFRARHGLVGRFVVMYSGNHSPIHPLDTLLEAAKQLANEPAIVFCFIGGGSEFQRVKQMAGQGRAGEEPGDGNLEHSTSNIQPRTEEDLRSPRPSDGRGVGGENSPSQGSRIEPMNQGAPPLPAFGHPLLHSEWRRGTGRGGAPVHGEGRRTDHGLSTANPRPSTLNSQLPNALCLPYQPFDQLSASLSAADAHVVVMGDAFVGLVHPCKVYNILRVAAPVIYIGPQPSHVTEILNTANQHSFVCSPHGGAESLVQGIQSLRRRANEANGQRSSQVNSRFSKETLIPRLITALESD
jgi:glycosyltransferase involved in cell wall biosynthesis